MTTNLGVHQKGFGLLEPLIAIVILSFGLLGLARFQLNMLAQSADSKMRLSATNLADELLARVRMDTATKSGTSVKANARCYANDPPADPCDSSGDDAKKAFVEWKDKAVEELGALAGTDKSHVSANSVLDVDLAATPPKAQLRVTLTWTVKGSAETHSHTVSTDVRND